jgi:LAO/AO transport system kinase
LDELWDLVQEHRRSLSEAGVLEEKRRAQRARWMWNALEERLMDAFRDHPEVAAQLEAAQERVRGGEQTPEEAAEGLLGLFLP